MRGQVAADPSQLALSTYDARLASEEAISASCTAWSMLGDMSVTVTVTSVPFPAVVRCQIIVMVPAYAGRRLRHRPLHHAFRWHQDGESDLDDAAASNVLPGSVEGSS